MARRAKSEITVGITGEADFDAARREIEQGFRRIERAADETVDEIERAFERSDVQIDVDVDELDDAQRAYTEFAQRLRRDGVDVDVDVDDAQLRQAFELAGQLDRFAAEIDVEADISDIREAERLASTLRQFTARIGLDVDGRADLLDALGIAESLDKVRSVKVDVQGRLDLERAEQIADGLERRRTVPIDARVEDLQSLDAEFDRAGDSAADAFIGGFDPSDVGSSALGGITGALGKAGPYGAVAATVGAFFGAEFVEGFNREFNSTRGGIVRSFRTGLSDADMAAAGEAAGEVWANGFGESLSSVTDTAALIQAELGSLDEGLDLTEATRQAEAFAEIWGIDVAESVRVAQRLVSNDLADSTVDAFNLMAGGAQDFGIQTEDALDVIAEFSPVFRRLGIDGARAFEIMGRQVDEGLVPSVDRVAEQFEEFNIRVTDGSAAEAIEQLGFRFTDIQERLASGDGASALAEIAAALAYSTTEAEATALAVDIFGASVESASDPERVFELLATADAIGEVGTVASDAATELDQAQTSFDRLGKAADEAGSFLARILDLGIADQIGDDERAWAGYINVVADGLDVLESWGIESGRLDDDLRGLSGGVTELTGVTDILADGIERGADEFDGLAAGLPMAASGFEEVASEAGEAADEIEDTTEAVDGLLDAIGGLFDFGADQLFREVAEASDDLAEAFAATDASAIGLGGAIDITADGGAELQETLEDVNRVLLEGVDALANNRISADQFRQIQQNLEGQLREVGRQAGLTGQEIDGLRDYYLALPPSVITQILADPAAAQRIVDEFIRRNQRLQLAVSFIGPTGSRIVTAGDLKFRARGGMTSGLTVLGEEGPELVDFRGNAYVYTASETKEILAGATAEPARASVSAPLAPAPAAQGRALIENATIVTPPGRDMWQELAMAEAVYS